MSAIEREKIEELVHKYQNRSISPKEFEQLHAWYLEQNDTLIELPLENEQRFMQIKNRMLDNLNQKLNEESRHEFSPRHSIWNRKWVRIGAAAAAILDRKSVV